MQTTSRQDEARQERFDVRHRNPLARDFVIVSRAVLIGYPQLSDGAKLTYWVISSHDWYERKRGSRKGYAYPTIARLALLRRTTDRTIQRHLADLIGAGLLTREARHGKPNVLYIEEPSAQETERAVELTAGGDKNVTPPPTKMSPHKKEENKQTKHVNGVEKSPMEEGSAASAGWVSLKRLLAYKTPSQSDSHDQWLAEVIVEQTGDRHSLGCYHTIARRCPREIVFEALSLLKEAQRDGTVKRSRGALFIGIVRRLCRERGLLDPVGTGARSAGDLDGFKPAVADTRGRSQAQEVYER
jgi:hypothetical protein